MKVLLVEDDRKIAGAVKRGLEAEGFGVEVAFDGTDGLWLATESSFDVLILDLMLPGRSGFQICEALRAADDWSPILVLTAKDGELDQTEALDTGADDYLTKPFSFPVLVARVRALARRAQVGHTTPDGGAHVGDLRIDAREHRCWRGVVPIALTAREFAVLEFLMRRAGQVLAKSQILDGVWDFDFEGDPNIVEVYIRRLRRKVDEPFGRSAIETIRRVGYRLSPDGG